MITFVPHPGTVLVCDFDALGFREPMMRKKRRVVVVQRRVRDHRPTTILVVPLSTTPPLLGRPWHHRIPAGKYGYLSATQDVFVKGDMVCAVPISALDRLNLNGAWIAPALPPIEYLAIQNAVREAMAI